jgi:hypothetical protein
MLVYQRVQQTALKIVVQSVPQRDLVFSAEASNLNGALHPTAVFSAFPCICQALGKPANQPVQ